MTRTRTVMMMLSVAATATPLAALTPLPPPEPIAGKVVERYIVCYPRIDAVRSRYREEVASLEQHHKAARDRLGRGLEADDRPNREYPLHRYDQAERSAADLVFLPVLRACGFKSVAEYGEAMRSVIHYFPSKPDWLRPYLKRVDALRVWNLN